MVEGHRILVGTSRFLQEQGVEATALGQKQAELEDQGWTAVLVAADGGVLGLIAIGDTLKEDAGYAVAKMKAEGFEPVMITGDNWRTARAVAAQVGIDQVLPNEKANEVRKLQQQGYRVAMVGDGINDPPALMQADVGIAIGAGTDIAIESADIILVGEKLSSVVDAYHIGRNSFTKTVQNVSLAFFFNGVGVPAAMTGFVHPVWAMIAMAASVTVVLLNSFGDRVISLPSFLSLPRWQRRKERGALTLQVPSMHCEGCAEAVETAVKDVPGVEAVAVDLTRKSVTVDYEDGVAVEDDVRKHITEAGHTVG
jgi:Cu+-exporting ATPase